MSFSGKRSSVLVRQDSGISTYTSVSARKIKEPFVASKYVRFGLNERDILLYKEIFDMMDPKRRGYISPNDLKSALLSIGISLSRADLYNLVCDYDHDEEGVLSFEDFLKAITGEIRPCDEDTKDDYKRVFSKLSGNKTHITKEDLLKTMRSIGLQQTDEEFQRMYEKLGVLDELITFETFHQAITNFIYTQDNVLHGVSDPDPDSLPTTNGSRSPDNPEEKKDSKMTSFLDLKSKPSKTVDFDGDYVRSKKF
jgi:Ca2+-binding EF-hand superfamily protein